MRRYLPRQSGWDRSAAGGPVFLLQRIRNWLPGGHLLALLEGPQPDCLVQVCRIRGTGMLRNTAGRPIGRHQRFRDAALAVNKDAGLGGPKSDFGRDYLRHRRDLRPTQLLSRLRWRDQKGAFERGPPRQGMTDPQGWLINRYPVEVRCRPPTNVLGRQSANSAERPG